ncbi:histone-lysine N-methyltransferase set1-like [Cydia amplana]|uniref:histone-lysine N-methyltransferase set1-like n=1 Tax=Cydia amplana TaxID=1869771 RepID=UPI002FE68731
MDALYNDLENYDDVDALNRLKTENSDLKNKLECCTANMQKLQKSILQDFDNLEAEFKRLESNYSSLLKISRAEIKRKTDMITNLNIEKDLLVIKAVQNGPAHKVQELIRNVREETEFKRKKKTRNKVRGPKGREEVIRKKSSRPQSPATSSTATDKSYKMLGNEIVADNGNNKKSSIMDTQDNDLQKPPTPHEVFPDNRPSSSVADKRVSALSRPHLAKLSSDEEFEDMYSALKPKASREPERTRKRGRDDSQDGKMLYNSSYDRPSNCTDPFRERFNRNRAGRFSDTERITREKQHSDPGRNINRGKYHYDRNRNVSDLQHHRFSPERHRRGAKDVGDNRYNRTRRLESPPRERQRLESPPRERLRLGSPPQERQELRKSSPRRKSYHGRTGDNPEIHSVIHNIHGEYEEPQNKKPRIEPYPVPQEEKRPSEEQHHNVSQPPNVGNLTCWSPDFSHTESSNEPGIAQTETRSTPSPVVEDPRLSSERYANANEIYLQPVDISLWNFKEVKVPKAIKSKPLEISEAHVDKIDIEKPLSSISMESGEIRSDTETALDIYDFQEFNKQIGKSVPYINESQKPEIKPHKEKSPTSASDTLIMGTKTTRLKVAKKEKANNHREAESMVSTSKHSHKVDTAMHCDNIKLPSILHTLINSMNEKRPEGDNSVKNSKGEKEPKHIAASRISNKSEKSKAKSKDDRENQNESGLKTDKNKADKLEKGSEKEPNRIAAYRTPNEPDKSGSKARDDRKNQNDSDLKIDNNKTDKLEKGSEKEPKRIAAYRTPNESEKSGSNSRDDRKKQNDSDLETDNNKTDKLERGSEKEPKRIAAIRISNKSDKLGSKTRDDIKNQNEPDLETDSNKTDKLEKGSEKEPKRIAAIRISNKYDKLGSKTRDDIKNQNESDLETDNNKTDKLEKGSEKESKRIAAIRIPNKSDYLGSKTRDDIKNQNLDLETENNKTDELEKGSEKEPKLIAAYRIPKKSDKSGPKPRDHQENHNESDLETDNNKRDKLGKRSEKEPKRIAAYRIPNKSDKSGLKTSDDAENQNESNLETDNNKTDKPEKRSDKIPKRITELQLSGKTEKESLKTTDKMLHKNVPEVKKTDNLEKVTEKGTEKEIKRIAESKVSDRNEKASLKTNEIEHKKVKEKPVKGTENNVTVFREFEHRVYSRHIVEGDLELSDESNDEAQLESEDKIEEKKKISSKSKSLRETYKDKRVNSEETTRKDKQKERKSMNKFSELFGDSSSLITPEDLNVATRTAHGLPADCCPPAAEEAQDAIIEPESPLKAQSTEMYPKDFKESLAMSTVDEDKLKIKELKDRTRTKHKQNKDDYVEQVGDVRTQVVTITETCSVSEGNLMSNTSNYTNQREVSKLNEKVKESSKSNKRPKTKGEKKLSVSEHTEEMNTNNINISELNSNNSPTMSDDKENSSSNCNSERNISNEMARIFENPIVSSKISSTNASETNKERPQLNDSTKEINYGSGVQDVPNLAPVEEEPGLVTTVVISTGVQPIDSTSAQYITPFSALASSTPARDLSAINISSEMESNVSHSAQVSVTISRDDSGSQPEDVPDMRITCYRRRRRVLKK